MLKQVNRLQLNNKAVSKTKQAQKKMQFEWKSYNRQNNERQHEKN